MFTYFHVQQTTYKQTIKRLTLTDTVKTYTEWYMVYSWHYRAYQLHGKWMEVTNREML